jgi:hypothetical protein
MLVLWDFEEFILYDHAINLRFPGRGIEFFTISIEEGGEIRKFSGKTIPFWLGAGLAGI